MPKGPPDTYLLLGQLGKTFQLEGGLRFYPLGNTEADAITTLNSVYITDAGFTDIRNVRMVGSHIIIYLSNALSVESARRLVNKEVYADPEQLPLNNDSYYIDALIDLPVHLNNTIIGHVIDVIDAGGQDLLVVDTENGEKLLPIEADYLQLNHDHINLTNPPDGLLEL